jgi:hypothetical protein
MCRCRHQRDTIGFTVSNKRCKLCAVINANALDLTAGLSLNVCQMLDYELSGIALLGVSESMTE